MTLLEELDRQEMEVGLKQGNRAVVLVVEFLIDQARLI
jgi:hypothetical protein